MPNELNFPFLEKLRLKTIVIVSPEEPSARLYAVCEVVFPCGFAS
jgi:hypothetical protein